MDNTLNYNIRFETNAGKINAGIDKLDGMLNNAGRDAKKMGNKFSQAMDSMNKKLSTIRMDSFINNIGHAADGLNALADPGLKLNSSLQDLSAITDVTGDKLKEIEGYARDSAKTFGTDAAAGVESYKLILSQLTPEIAKQPKALEAMGTSVNILSKQMGGNTTAATEVLTTALNQYQVSLDDPIKASGEMTRMMNIMAAAAKEGSAELPEQKAALEQSGLAAKTANVSFAETAAAIQVLDKAGKKGSEGGVALRNTLATLAQGRFLPKDVQQELQAAGVDVNVLGDKTKSLADRLRPLKSIMNDSALITKLFGKENSNAAIAMISGIDEQERLTKAIVNTNTAQEQANIVMESQAEKNARLKARVDDFKISLFNATGGAMGYASVLGDVARDTANLIPVISGAGKALAFMTNATKLQSLWNGIVSVGTKAWAAAQWLLNAAMDANPIGLITAGITALGAGIAWVVSKTEGWGEAWQHTVNGAKLLWQMFTATAEAHFNTLVNGFMVGINLIKRLWINLQIALGNIEEKEGQKQLAKIKKNSKARLESIKEGYKQAKEYAVKAKEEFGKAVGSIQWKSDESEATPTEANKIQGGPGAIKAPSFPGTTNTNNTGGGQKKQGSQSKTNTAIATGGSKSTNITLNLKELIGVLNIQGSDFKDSAKQMEEQSTDAMLRVFALAATAGN